MSNLPLMPDVEPDIIFTNSYFDENHRPAVYWQYKGQNGLISLTEARARAQSLFQAVGYAEGEVAIVKGLVGLHQSDVPKGFGVLISQKKEQAEMEALRMAAQLREFLRKGRSPLLEGLEVIFGLHTRRALINCDWYGKMVQLEVAEALSHAIILVETAEAAESDAYFRWFLIERIGLEAEEAYPMIGEFQTFRYRRQLEDSLGLTNE